MLTRRRLLPLVGAAMMPLPAAALADGPAVTVGVLEFGTVSWEIETMRRFGLDTASGFKVEPTKLASNDAARIAFLGGAVDTIVSDLLWAARLRAEGRNLVFIPFSSTEGAVMVPGGSTIRTVADLAGARIGVSGGPLDKTWLLLQAMTRDAAKLDLASAAKPAFGAPPLLAQKLEAGELDAALLYWNFCARLEAKGFRQLIGADDIVRSFGIAGPITILGYVFDADRFAGRPAILPGFAAASREAKARLASNADAWTAVRPLMAAADEPTFAALKRRFLDGVPHRPLDVERAEAGRLYDVLVRLGGEKLVGSATRLPPGLYWTDAS